MTKPRTGQVVLLKRGTKSKRKYNNEEAFVKEVPRRGCWMTVQVKGESDDSLLKWRKGGFHRAASHSQVIQNVDPFTIDEVAVKILSYLFGECPAKQAERVQTIWLRNFTCHKGVEQLGSLRLVSALWNSIFTNILPTAVGQVAVDLFEVKSWTQHMVHWLCREKGIKLSSLWVRYAELGDIPFVAKLITRCHTHQLTRLGLFVNRDRKQFGKSMYALNPERRGGATKRTAIDLRDANKANEKWQVERKAMGHIHELKSLHTLIAEQCPRLTELEVMITFPCHSADYSNIISPALFSMPSITSLGISMGYLSKVYSMGSPQIDSDVITQLIQNLSNLKSLQLTARNTEICFSRRYHIASPSLEHVNVEGLSKHMWASCACPQLRSYRCNGHAYGNGTRPLLTATQYKALEGKEGLVVNAGQYEFPHFDVPDTCVITLADFWSRGGSEAYAYYNIWTQRLANATDEAF